MQCQENIVLEKVFNLSHKVLFSQVLMTEHTSESKNKHPPSDSDIPHLGDLWVKII